MALDDDIRLIGSVGFFEGLTTEQLRLLAFGAESMRLSAGRELYREGATADGAFIIAAGEMDLTTLKGNRLVTLKTLGPGAILSDVALIAPTRRATGAMARTDGIDDKGIAGFLAMAGICHFHMRRMDATGGAL